jgi:thiol-disulfide isomerase/thioredoxin
MKMIKLITAMSIISLFACKTGEPIPSFTYQTIEGKTLSNEDLKGKATILVVWATWCGDCIREIPELNELVSKYEANENVVFIAFSDEDEQTVNKSLARFPFSFQHIINSKAYSDKLKSGLVKHFPQVMVLNKDTEIVFEVTENKKPIFQILDNHIQDILSN